MWVDSIIDNALINNTWHNQLVFLKKKEQGKRIHFHKLVSRFESLIASLITLTWMIWTSHWFGGAWRRHPEGIDTHSDDRMWSCWFMIAFALFYDTFIPEVTPLAPLLFWSTPAQYRSGWLRRLLCQQTNETVRNTFNKWLLKQARYFPTNIGGV